MVSRGTCKAQGGFDEDTVATELSTHECMESPRMLRIRHVVRDKLNHSVGAHRAAYRREAMEVRETHDDLRVSIGKPRIEDETQLTKYIPKRKHPNNGPTTTGPYCSISPSTKSPA